MDDRYAPFALFEVLEYGLAYLLARLHMKELGLAARPLMRDGVRHVRLEVVGPRDFFAGSDHFDLFCRMHNALAKFTKSKTNDQWSMSLHAIVFPDSFNTVPFASGEVVPGPDIERILNETPGNELESGKFDRPTSSAALAVNAFGYFLRRPAALPRLPGSEPDGWPARSLALEKTIRFPWRGGRHPVLDCVVATGSALVGIECKWFEPFRGGRSAGFTDTFWRPVWGERMGGFQRVRDLLRANQDLYAFLDAA